MPDPRAHSRQKTTRSGEKTLNDVTAMNSCSPIMAQINVCWSDAIVTGPA